MFKNVLTNAGIYDNIYLSTGNGWQILKRGVYHMIATFKKLDKETNINVNHRKESHFTKQYTAVVFNGQCAYDAVTLRIYSTDAKSYCCLWVHDNCSWVKGCRDSYYRSGSGSAGGYGYHRASAAAQNAIYNAGITLSEDIGGRGDAAIEEAVHAIAAAMWGADGYYIHVTRANA